MIVTVHRYLKAIICLGYGLVSIAGFLSFCFTHVPSVTPQVGTLPPSTELKSDLNLAYFKNGGWVRASSYAWLYIHHPMFVIDGLTRPPSMKEEWVPDRRTDKSPWIEIHFSRKADVHTVVLYHERRYSKRSYSLSCILNGKMVGRMESIKTKEERVVYPLSCKGVDGVRIDFRWDPFDPHGHIRIYEVEVWGR